MLLYRVRSEGGTPWSDDESSDESPNTHKSQWSPYVLTFKSKL